MNLHRSCKKNGVFALALYVVATHHRFWCEKTVKPLHPHQHCAHAHLDKRTHSHSHTPSVPLQE